jgi:tetratricopeptide (TPR) repeat protein
MGRVHDAMERQFQSDGLFEGAEREREEEGYSETFYPFSSFGWSPLHALETSRYHYIDAPQPELYDVESDPGETRNLATQQPATIAVFKEKLQQLRAHNPFAGQNAHVAKLSPDAQEKLSALGYFGFRAVVSPEAFSAGLADPKDKLWEFNTILKAEDAFQAKDVGRAEQLLSPVQQQDPKMYIIPFLLGEAALRNQNWQRAAEQLQRCLELNPNFDNAMTGLARAFAKLGRVDDAKSWLRKATGSNPQNYRAWYQLGLLEAENDPAAAQASYQKTIAIQPNFAPGQRELGMLLFKQKNYAAAVPNLEKAVALGLDDAQLHNFLGICYSQTNRLQKSIQSYRAALKLDPKLAEAHLNFAYELQRAGKLSQARAEYETACQLEARFCGAVPK